MAEFTIKHPLIKDPSEIERLSLETIMIEAQQFPKFKEFTSDQQKVVQRMIHTTTCFEQIIENIEFTPNATDKIKEFLKKGASIISDTNMIRSGLGKAYTGKYSNNVICNVAQSNIKELAEKQRSTRTVAAVNETLRELKNSRVIIACGNAPTMLYAAIGTLITHKWDLSKVLILAMPVGFINVVESKEYTLDFMNKLGIEGIVLNGRYGGSPLIVSCLHSLYKLL